MKNKDIQLKILDCIQEQLGVTLDYKFGNGYYLFDLGEDAVCHFVIPNRKGWKFGIWIDGFEDGKYKVRLFGEYKDYIDKFKPSACRISYGVKINETFEDLTFVLYDFIGELACVKDSNWASIIKYYWDGSRFGERTRPFSWLLSQFWYHKIRKNVSRLWNDKLIYWHLKARVFFDKIIIGRNFSKIEIDDRERDGFTCWPRYELVYRFKDAGKDNTYRLYRFAKRYKYQNARIDTQDENGKSFSYKI